MAKVVRIDSYTKDCAGKTRVAAYARVSTDSNEQLASLEAQKAYYDSYIKSKPEWEYAGLYYDEGVSGTKKDKRDGLLGMLEDCRKGKIDFIIVKSISRLARNTVDTLMIVRELYDLGIFMYFEKENINTSKMSGELLLTILSGIAESESKSISKNEKWAIQKRFEQGTFVIGCPPYGYVNNKGVMEIVPEEAEIVKRIFSLFLSGNGSYSIARTLNEEGIVTKRNGRWTSNTIVGILKNEKYTGDVLYQKTYTDEHFNRHKNCDGEREQYYVKDHHEPIISHEDFELAQELRKHNCTEKNVESRSGKYGKRYLFSGRIICGDCGASWKRRIHHSKAKGEYIAYACQGHIEDKKTCSIKYIREETFCSAFCTVMNKLTAGMDIVLRPLAENMKVIDDEEVKKKIFEIDRKLEKNEAQKKKLNGLLIKQYIDREVYTAQAEKITTEDAKLKEERESYMRTMNCGTEKAEAVDELIRYTGRHKGMTEFDEEIFDRFVDHIIVINRNELDFVFRCGLALKERF